MTELLKIENLSKSFSGVHAVQDVSFAIQPNTITGLIGPNGSGKSTLIDSISGFQRVDSGRVLFQGTDITNWEPHRVARLGLVRTFQTVRVYDDMSLRQNLVQATQPFDGANWLDDFFRTSRYRRGQAEAADRANYLLDLIGLKRKQEAPAAILSYGQKKLLALGAALMTRPKLVVLDEPVAGVNPSKIREIEEVILRLHAEGETFVIVEHNVDFIMRLSSRVITLASGSVLMDGKPEQVRTDPRVMEAYLGIRA